MKRKKLIASLIIFLVVMLFTVDVFAFTAKDGARTVESSVNNLEEDVTSNQTTNSKNTENKSDEGNISEEEKSEVTDTEVNENSDEKTTTNETLKKDDETNDQLDDKMKDNIMLISEDIGTFYKNEIYKDVIDVSDKNVEYKNTYVDGNVFIVGSEQTTLKDCTVNGSIFIVANKNVEIENVEINGSIYIVSAGTLNLTNCYADSIYSVVEEKITADEDTTFLKESRFLSKNVELSGKFARTVYIEASKVTVLSNTVIKGDLNIEASDNIDVSKNAEVTGEINQKIVSNASEGITFSLRNSLLETLAEFIIILVVAIFILGGFPKFTEVNKTLRLRDFVLSFFTGLLEIVVIFAIAFLICTLGYGIGYAFALVMLTIIFAMLGKLIFVVAFAIRLGRNPEKISKIKVFIVTIFVALIVEAIGMLSVLGTVGLIISIIFNILIGISGFGTMMKVIFTSRRKMKSSNKKIDNITDKDVKQAEESKKEEARQAELQAEVRKEIREEIEEMQNEREKEKQLKEDTENKELDEKDDDKKE